MKISSSFALQLYLALVFDFIKILLLIRGV